MKLNFKYIYQRVFLVTFAALSLVSCSEDDDEIVPSRREDVTIGAFFEGSSLTSFNPFAELAKEAYVSFDLKDQFNLGTTITTPQIEAVVSSFSEEIRNVLSDVEVSNLTLFNQAESASNERITLSNVADSYPLKESSLNSLRTFFETFESNLNKQRKAAQGRGEDPTSIKAEDIVFSPFNLDGDDVFNVLDVLSSNGTFTVFATRALGVVNVYDPNEALEADRLKNVSTGVNYTNAILSNILPQQVNFQDLQGDYVTLSGQTITVSDALDDESEVVGKMLSNGPSTGIILDNVVNNIGAATNGVIHQFRFSRVETENTENILPFVLPTNTAAI